MGIRTCRHLSTFVLKATRVFGKLLGLVPLDMKNNYPDFFSIILIMKWDIIIYVMGFILYGSKIQNMKIISNWVLIDAKWWEYSKYGLKFKSNNIWPIFGPNTVKDWQNAQFSQFSTLFGPKGSNVIGSEFWGQTPIFVIIWHLLGPNLIAFTHFDFLWI